MLTKNQTSAAARVGLVRSTDGEPIVAPSRVHYVLMRVFDLTSPDEL